MKIVWITAGILAGLIIILYLISAIYKFLNQSRYVYYPTRELIATPSDIGLSYEKVILETIDGVKLSGWYIPSFKVTLEKVTEKERERRVPIVLIFHGNGGNISHNLEVIELFHELGLCVFIVDYRGFGESEGKPTEKGTYLDALCCWEYLLVEKKVLPKNIIIYGYSLGGAIASWLASRKNPGALILDSTFTSIKDMGAKLYPYLPVRKFFRFSYNTLEYLERVSCPVLIIHSKTDDYIPYEHGLKLFEEANHPKEFLQIYGSHIDGFVVSKEIYSKKIESFISKYISKANA